MSFEEEATLLCAGLTACHAHVPPKPAPLSTEPSGLGKAATSISDSKKLFG